MTLSDMDSDIVCLFQTLKYTHTKKKKKNRAWKSQLLGNVLLENLMIDGIGAQILQMGVASSWRKQS